MPVLAVAASAAIALAVVCVTMPAPQMQIMRGANSAPAAHLVQDEHALIGNYLREQMQADRAADVAADRAWTEERSVAQAQTDNRVAALKPARPVVTKPVQTKLAQVARTVEPASTAGAVGEPLQLQAALASPSVPHRPVMERVKSAIASVERIPHWMTAGVQQAADWVTDLPVGTIVGLPERRFL
jgi:hypothetical protein